MIPGANLSRIFAYCRVSTTDQTVNNQIHEIANAGFSIENHRTVTETISGSVAMSERPGFQKLMDRVEPGDVLVVTKLDRLGRNAVDVRLTVELLTRMGVRVHCLALGGVDLTSPAGKMTMSVINAMAEFERDLLVERTQAGLTRAKLEGKILGRPPAHETTANVLKLKEEKFTQTQTAAKLEVSLATVKRHWNKSLG